MRHPLSPFRTPEVSPSGVERVLDERGQADPRADPGLPLELVQRMYRGMLRNRLVDDRMLALQRQGRVGFHVGARGEEAAVIASAAALEATDWILPCYRELGALLWRGFPLSTFVDNMFGNADDVVKGRQMPDHYTGRAYYYGSVSSPVGTQIPQAVGLAWAARLRGERAIVGVYFGDGATSTGDFHAGLNFAGVSKAPTLFLCRNNRWAISLPSEKQSASASLAGKAVAYGIKGVRCDGNDALAVYRTVHAAAERARRGEGPSLIELLTYRLGSHSSSDDPRAYRPDGEVERFSGADPITRLRHHLELLGGWSERQEAEFRAEVEAELKSAVAAAEAKPAPPIQSLFDDVYATRPRHLDDQLAECLAGPRASKGH